MPHWLVAARQAGVAFALERLERAQQHSLAAASATDLQESVERVERHVPQPTVRCQVAIFLLVTVERGESALQEGDRDRRPHVDARVEQLRGEAVTPLCHLVETRPLPVEAEVDGDSGATRQLAHGPRISVGSRHRLRDAEAGRPALVCGVVNEPTFAVDQCIDQIFHTQHIVNCHSPSASRRMNNQKGYL